MNNDLRALISEAIRSVLYESDDVADHMHEQAASQAASLALYEVISFLRLRLIHDEEGVIEMLSGGKGPLEKPD